MEKEKYMTIREWKENFEKGEFDSKNTNTQIKAGWYDWFCADSSLLRKTKNFYKFIRRIKSDFILDNYRIWFKNNCPCNYPLYNDIRFEPITKDNERHQGYFLIAENCGFYGKKYCLIIFIKEDNNEEEKEFDSLKELMNYINQELEPKLKDLLKDFV